MPDRGGGSEGGEGPAVPSLWRAGEKEEEEEDEHFGDQLGRAGYRADELPDLIDGQHQRHPRGAIGPEGVDLAEIVVEDFAGEEQQCVKGLILGRGGYFASDRQVAQEPLHLKGPISRGCRLP